MTVEVQGLDPDRMVILSLKPRFAEAILAGVKTVELRRTELKIVVPTRALLYAASPVRALLGTCIITSVQSMADWRYKLAMGTEITSLADGLVRGR